ncbi:DUF4446 family protein [Nocardioides aequoreus]|uniref:DUF4446 family protein n=1 Tax=Nocardioides aequoreus TaxID=397278 RepID=UPI0004C386EB|nr:DUF4446 family protein [Nocardioides aequoreus]
MQTFLAVLALLVAVAALVVAWRGRGGARRRPVDEGDLPTDVQALRREVAALRREGAQSMRHVAVVRYDAFTDTGGQLSWSLALLDDAGSGVLLTSIQGRAESRTYAKSIADWKCDQQLSPEEQDALSHARP